MLWITASALGTGETQQQRQLTGQPRRNYSSAAGDGRLSWRGTGEQHTWPKQERESKGLGLLLRWHRIGTTRWHSMGSQGRAKDPTLPGSAPGLPLQKGDNAQVSQGPPAVPCASSPTHMPLFHCLCAMHIFPTGIIKSVFSAPKWAVPFQCHWKKTSSPPAF